MADPGEGSGGLGTPLFLDQTEAQRDQRPHPLSKGLDDRLPFSQGLDPALQAKAKWSYNSKFLTFS